MIDKEANIAYFFVVKIIDKDVVEVESASGGLMDYYSFDKTMCVWECNLHPIE